jgi:peptidoglycan-associated lipoprotein
MPISNRLRWPLVLTLIAVPLFAASCAKKATQAPPTQTTEPTPVPQTTPPPAPAPAPTSETPAPAPFTVQDLRPVFFELDSYALNDAARAALDADAKMLRDNGSTKVVIEGHCDERGTSEYNQALGEKRAQAARDYLTAAGIDASRLSIVSYGKERPFDPGHDESAWAKNRRAHFSPR